MRSHIMTQHAVVHKPFLKIATMLQLRLNQWKDAVKHCRLVLEVESGNVKALYRRAQVRERLTLHAEPPCRLCCNLKPD